MDLIAGKDYKRINYGINDHLLGLKCAKEI